MSALLRLLQLSDPALPIGGYAHSAGLETYVQSGVVHDRAGAEDFVRSMLRMGIHYTDAALAALAYKAAETGDTDEVKRLDQLCEAVKLPREVREASRKLGVRLMKVFGGQMEVPLGQEKAIVGQEKVGDQEKVIAGQVKVVGLRHYSVVFGYCAAMLGIGLREALTGYYYNAAAGMVTNCVKLIPIGQQDGQAILFGLQPLIMELVEKSLVPERELIGMCSTGFDISSMQHEQLYSRLYMS